MRYEFAEDLARQIKPEKGMRVFVCLSGRFIAGDFLEAWIVEHGIKVKEMTISTLSMSESNIDSLATLMQAGAVQNLNLIVSNYFFSHERRNLIPYIYQELDKEDRFQLAVCGTHCKIIAFETEAGAKVVIHGSANLRSSGNMEQICIEENPELYDFNQAIFQPIIEKYYTVKKSVRHSKLWSTLN